MLAQWLSRVRNYFISGRGGAAAATTVERRHAAREPDPSIHDDLTVIRGIGAATQQRLYAIGITTYARLGRATGDEIRKTPGKLPPGANVESWIVRARELANGS